MYCISRQALGGSKTNGTHVVVAVARAGRDHLLKPREALAARCGRGDCGKRLLDGKRVDVRDVPASLSAVAAFMVAKMHTRKQRPTESCMPQNWANQARWQRRRLKKCCEYRSFWDRESIRTCPTLSLLARL